MANKGLAAQARVIALPQYGTPRDAAIRALLENPGRPRAIFCWSDLDAIPLISEAHRLGIRVPEDLAVIGYDNSPMAALSMVDLSSVDQDGPRLGKLAAEALFSRIKGRHGPEHILIEPRLVCRRSI
jgi:LacI family transcriptional regulator